MAKSNHNHHLPTHSPKSKKSKATQNSQQSNPTTVISPSPIAKLLGNRPTAVEGLVSKVEAISFEGIHQSDLHLQHQQQLPTRPHQDHYQQFILPTISSDPIPSSSIPQVSTPPLSLTHSSPPTDLAQRLADSHDHFAIRDTPTIRQLKTSLRSRLNVDSAHHQRSSQDSGKSDLNLLSSSPPPHPQQLSPSSNPTSLRNRQTSTASSSTKSNLSTPSSNLPLAHTISRSSSSSSSFNPSTLQPQLYHQNDPRRLVSTSFIPRSHPYREQLKNRWASFDNPPSGFEQPFSHLGVDPVPPRPSHPSPGNPSPRPSINLPNLHLPFINMDLSPPGLALWTLEAYDCGRKIEFADLMVHLMVLPLHTAIAISRKLPGVGHRLDLITPLLHQAEKENQSILLTATQIGLGLILASGWKVARKFLSSSR